MQTTLSLTLNDFLSALDAPAGEAGLIADEVSRHDFKYRRLAQNERDVLILSILKKIETFSRVGEHRHNIWEMAWADVAKRYEDAKEDPAALEPSFISGTREVRLAGDFALPLASGFEFNYFRVVRLWLFRKYLAGAKTAYEFGCGSGFNLVALAHLFPEMKLTGLDWAQPAVDLINRVAKKRALNLTGRRFDFFHPDPDLQLEPGSIAMTFCALEQTGERFDTFIKWLCGRKPALVVSMEPAIELYDPNTLFDDLVIRYHTQREYLRGYIPYVRKLEAEGKAEILHCQRLGLGSLFHEAYSLLIWRPV